MNRETAAQVVNRINQCAELLLEALELVERESPEDYARLKRSVARVLGVTDQVITEWITEPYPDLAPWHDT